MPLPRISVLLPARNAAATVEAAVRSVLDDGFSELEVLAVEDGSTDGTGAVLERLARADPRVRVLQGGGRGLVHALELARREARAPRYLARMDADDVSLPGRFQAQLLALEADPALAAVGTGVEVFRDDRPVSPNLRAYAAWLNALTTAEAAWRDRCVESPLCHPSVLLRRDALERVGGWKDEDVPEDWALWLGLLEAGFRVRSLDRVLLRWRDHDARLTRTDARYRWDAHQALKARHLARTLPPGPLVLWGAGELGLALFRRLRDHGVRTELFVDLHPRKVGTRLEGVMVVRPEALGPPSGRHLVAAVGAKGARAEIRGFLAQTGWVEGRDFTCAG